MDEQKNNTSKRSVTVKAYKLKEIAELYRVSLYLMRRLISKNKKAIGKREGYFYSTEQVEKIFQLIKLPSEKRLL